MTSAIDMVMMVLAMRMTMIMSEWWWFIWIGLTYTPPQSTGHGIQNGCAGRWTFKKNSVYWGIYVIKKQWDGWQSREVVLTAKRRWRGRSRGPEPAPRLRCAGSDTWGAQTRWSCTEFVKLGDWVFWGKYSYSSSVLAPKYHFPVPQAP